MECIKLHQQMEKTGQSLTTIVKNLLDKNLAAAKSIQDFNNNKDAQEDIFTLLVHLIDALYKK